MLSAAGVLAYDVFTDIKNLEISRGNNEQYVYRLEQCELKIKKLQKQKQKIM